MAIDKNKHKVSESEIAENQIQGKNNPLNGGVEENQKMFDNLPKKAIEKHNQFVEAVVEEFQTVTSSVENQIKDVNADLDNLSDETQKELKDKVDKEEGKGLSTNDFTNEYKNKLDNLDRTIGEEVERVSGAVDVLSDEFDSYKEDATLKLNLKADKTTTDDLQRQVNNKADKSDITSVYRFRGSVEKYEYLLPLVDVAEGDVYNVIEDGMNYAWTGTEWDTLGGEHIDTKARNDIDALKLVVQNEVPKAIRDSVMPLEEKDALIREEIAELSKNVETKVDKTTVDDLRSQVNKKADATAVYTRAETNALLANKVNKEDIVSAYKFCGSVDTFDEELMTPATYEIIPKGNPTYNGVVVGTYDAENRTVTIDSKKLEGWDDYEVVVPIEEIVVPKGYYSCKWDISIAGMDGYWADGHYAYKKNNEEIVTTVSIGHYGYHDAGTIELGNLKKYSSVEVELTETPFYNADYQVIATLETGNVYNVLDSGMNYAWTGTEWDALGGSVSDESVKEDIDKIKTELDKKANKEDIVSAYRFCGSVNKFDDLPVRYALIPNGVPTHNGVACGTYDEETHTVTVNDELLVEVGVDRIIIPIVPISIKAGKYFTEYVYYGNASIGSLDTYECGAGGSTYVEMPEQTIDRIEIFTPYGEETISGTTNSIGTLDKITDSWLIDDYTNVPDIPIGAYNAGAIYEVKESGLSYGWTGSSWDALGTSHIDQEARDGINSQQIQIDSMSMGVIEAHNVADEANSRSYSNMYDIENLRAEIEELKAKILNT